jgi:hypothetical protein
MHVWATDPELVKWAQAEVRGLFPKCRADTNNLLQNQPLQVQFDKLDGRAHLVAWHLLRVLCERGWEPLGCAESNTGLTYQLRHAVDH